MVTTIPGTDSLLNTIQRIVNRLHQQEHLLRLRDTVSIRQLVTLLTILTLQDLIAFCYQDWSYLHHANRITTLCSWISLTLYLNYRLHHWIPIKLIRGNILFRHRCSRCCVYIKRQHENADHQHCYSLHINYFMEPEKLNYNISDFAMTTYEKKNGCQSQFR